MVLNMMILWLTRGLHRLTAGVLVLEIRSVLQDRKGLQSLVRSALYAVQAQVCDAAGRVQRSETACRQLQRCEQRSTFEVTGVSDALVAVVAGVSPVAGGRLQLEPGDKCGVRVTGRSSAGDGQLREGGRYRGAATAVCASCGRINERTDSAER